MDEETKAMLEEELQDEIRRLYSLAPGTKEKTEAINGIVSISKLIIEDTKLSDEAATATDAEEREERQKAAELKEKRIDRYFRVGVEVTGIVLPLVVYVIWMGKGFEFEKTGTFTSKTFMNLFQKFKPTK